MVQGCGLEQRETIMWESGDLEKQMDMVFMFGSTEIDTKANLNNA
jgi:hypothetical protein